MAERIFLIDGDEQLQPMLEQPYRREDILQNLLARYPDLLAGDQIDPEDPRRWLLVKREMEVPDAETSSGRWSLDHLFLDQDGIPTFVETKRSSDTRLRREVLGQMLDYAANSVAYWSVDMVRNLFEQRCAKEGLDVETEMANVDVEDAHDFWERVKNNLEAKRIRLVFVADAIPRELRSIIEFLNEQMTSVEVLGVEIRQFVAEDGRRTIVPRVLGQTEKAQQRKGGSSQRNAVAWTAETFLEKIERGFGKEAAKVAERLLHWSEANADQTWWNNSARGSFISVIRAGGQDHYPFLVGGMGCAEIQFMRECRKPPFDNEEKRREWARRLNEIPRVKIEQKSLTGLPKIPLDVLADPGAFDRFIAVAEWAITEMRAIER